MKSRCNIIIFLLFVFLFTTCKINDDDKKPIKVAFYNDSGYKVDVYKNLNPEHFDFTTLVCTLDPAETQYINQYPSYDQVFGDAFYPRYKVLLADSGLTGTIPIYAEAQPSLIYVPLVINNENDNFIKIPNQTQDELRFVNGYIVIHNGMNSKIKIIIGDTILPRMDNGDVYINALSADGYYEIKFSYFDTTITMNMLKAYSSYDLNFPSFVMERGKKYIFSIQQDGTISGPVVKGVMEE
jgi:hypothetical protein